MLNDGVLAPPCDSILDQVEACWACHHVTALRQAIEHESRVICADAAPALTGRLQLLQKRDVRLAQHHLARQCVRAPLERPGFSLPIPALFLLAASLFGGVEAGPLVTQVIQGLSRLLFV